MFSKVAGLIPGRFNRDAPEDSESAPGVLTELDKKLGQKIQQRQAEAGRPIDTRHGGPNMPRRQPCTCGRQAKRKRKTMGGAYYNCSKHGEFFVRLPS